MKIIYPVMFIFCISVSFFCKPQSKGNKPTEQTGSHNSQNALDWDGVYRGTLPCADCEGIQTTITLSKDLAYKVKTTYLGKQDSVYEHSGKFSWNAQGNMITLDNPGSNQPLNYFVGENTLTQLDMNGNRITGPASDSYVLSKSNYAILEKYWKLTELNGKPIMVDSSYSKEPHIILKEKDNKVIGSGSCNNFSGAYKLGNNNQLSFSKMAITQMACINNMEVEAQFLKVLGTVDSYTVSGDMLVLNRARMAPLARFKTAYMK